METMKRQLSNEKHTLCQFYKKYRISLSKKLNEQTLGMIIFA